MSQTGDILAATMASLFETSLGEEIARASRQGTFAAAGWQAVEDAGFPLALLSEAEGGYGFDLAEALDLIRIGGYHAAPIPLGETMLANLLLARAGLPLAEGPATFFACDDKREAGGVPWARHAATLVAVRDGHVVRLLTSDVEIAPDLSPIGLPRDVVRWNREATGAILPNGLQPRALGALLRALEMAGALQRVLELTVLYANERIQFGRPIGKFQAVQQQLAILATQAAAARAAADFAAHAFDGQGALLAIAAAKSRVGEAAGIAAAIAHQVHGAIGFTEEHRLHLYTRALWAWRDEFGGEAEWEARLGAEALAQGGEGFWPFVTGVAA